MAEIDRERLKETAAQLRVCAARTSEPAERDGFLDAAAEADGMALNGSAALRAVPVGPTQRSSA